MLDTSHCKVKYDDQEDMDEISDFYDFSASEGAASAAAREAAGAGPEGAAGGQEEEEDFEAEVAARRAAIEVMPSGELCITRADGTRRTIGVRWLRQYYAQNARVIDERASVVANQREKLALL